MGDDIEKQEILIDILMIFVFFMILGFVVGDHGYTISFVSNNATQQTTPAIHQPIFVSGIP